MSDQSIIDQADDFVELDAATLPLDTWHRARGARMVEFAGYHMPIQYEGIMAEHLWTRENAGLFDVSHMGQLLLTGDGVATALEALVPGDISALKPGRIRYSLLLAEDGGILDDLMITNVEADGEQRLYVVVNGAMKWDDIAVLREHLPDEIVINHLEDRALLALQGPKAAVALEAVLHGVAGELVFMQGTSREWNGAAIGISRSGYTGEDGFELSVPEEHVAAFADALCAQPEVKPIGLGARDSLRLEAGLPLYGHDLDDSVDPVEGDLSFAISKRRREEGGFPGADRILGVLTHGATRKRVGFTVEGRQPVREGAVIYSGDKEVGVITSGGFAPSVGAPIAMGFLSTAVAPDAPLTADVRGKRIPIAVTALPFVPHRYVRKGG